MSSNAQPQAVIDPPRVTSDITATTHRHPLDPIFSPRSVAVIGATEAPGSVGRTLLRNLIGSPFGGTVYPVNPKRANVLGIRAYKSIADVPEPVDLAVIVTPAATVPGVVQECVDARARSAIVISAGFKEMGPVGAALEEKVQGVARRGNMRLIGPNCLGVMNPLSGLNATFAKGMAKPGNVAFLSQSGALLTAILDWSLREQVGFSGFVSTGSMLDVSWGDLIDYFGRDPHTRSILIYMESIGDARAFLSAAREVSLTKPIIVIKPGRTEQAAKAAASHTGSLTGGDDVIDAAFRRTGVLRVQTIADLFYMSEVLSKQPRPRGPRLTIVTNAGGPGVLATDALITGGGELAAVGAETMERLNAFLPAPWSHNNPIDVLGDAGAERYAKTLEIAAADPNSDGLLVILTPQDMTAPTQTAELLKQYAQITTPYPKPLLASWMGGPDVQAGEALLNHAGIPTFNYPDTAARMFSYMWRYTYSLHGLYETPSLDPESPEAEPDRAMAAAIVNAARAAGRTLLSEHESKALLDAYRIPTVRTVVTTTAPDAVAAAQSLGFPVVLKLHSQTITHKTDVGGVQLNLRDAASVERAFADIRKRAIEAGGEVAFAGVTVQPMVRTTDAYELIVGSSLDPQFGPVLLFGTGGQLVEVFKDRGLALPPLNATLARRMMEQTKIYHALGGVRGRKPVPMAQLEQLLVRFSHLVVEQRWIKEIDINPLLASADGLLALDARVVLHEPGLTEDQLPKLAIRPYPTQYVSDWTTPDGVKVHIRPIRPEDEPLLVAFHGTLGEQTVRMRYFASMQLDARTTHERLTRVCFNDYDRELALVVECRDPSCAAGRKIVAIGRLSKIPHQDRAEFALLVADAMQGKGLGRELLRRMIDIARTEKLKRLTADILVENRPMQHVCKALGFKITGELGDATVQATIEL
jgi:acetyltransferase